MTKEDSDIRVALADSARAVHPLLRLSGVTLRAVVEGVTYTATTSPAVWQIPAIEAALAVLTAADLTATPPRLL